MFDVIVIGGGPAGVTAALHARELGASVALVEQSRMGGTCTNDGCVPTRVLAKAARLARDADQFDQYGLSGSSPAINFERLLSRTQQVVYQIQEKKQLIKHLQETGVEVYFGEGTAHFHDSHTLIVGGVRRLEAKNIILCVGGHARRLNFPGAEYALTHSDVWSLKSLPKSMAIVGAAATGCQLASIFNAFGTQVTLLDIAPHILPVEDETTSEVVAASFQQRGIHLETGIERVDSIEKSGSRFKLNYALAGQAQSLEVEAVVFSVGWPANLEPLDLEAVGVATAHGYIQVNDRLQTSAPHIFAAGDVTGQMMLVQSASYEARVAVENAVLGTDLDFHHLIVPHGGFTDPEYASVGMSEAQARQEGGYSIATVKYSEMDRAVIDGYTDGFCKLVVSTENQTIQGAHVVGEQALEIVHVVAAAMAGRMPVSALANLEIAYPTYTAIIGLAARQITRQIGGTPLASQWRALGRLPLPEWERRDPSI
jgi:pyruvate/2-oxoglutarate dehydrogenase complex dihydrolipoamide dehydrogenase (E3) component